MTNQDRSCRHPSQERIFNLSFSPLFLYSEITDDMKILFSSILIRIDPILTQYHRIATLIVLLNGSRFPFNWFVHSFFFCWGSLSRNRSWIRIDPLFWFNLFVLPRFFWVHSEDLDLFRRNSSLMFFGIVSHSVQDSDSGSILFTFHETRCDALCSINYFQSLIYPIELKSNWIGNFSKKRSIPIKDWSFLFSLQTGWNISLRIPQSIIKLFKFDPVTSDFSRVSNKSFRSLIGIDPLVNQIILKCPFPKEIFASVIIPSDRTLELNRSFLIGYYPESGSILRIWINMDLTGSFKDTKVNYPTLWSQDFYSSRSLSKVDFLRAAGSILPPPPRINHSFLRD